MKRISLLLIVLVLSMGMKAHANQFLFLPSDDIVPVEMIATDDLGEDALGAEDIQDGEASEGNFNPGSVIIGHVTDAHSWHLFDYYSKDGQEHAVAIPLPVILINNGHFDCFMSSKFHHGHADYKGYRLVGGGAEKEEITSAWIDIFPLDAVSDDPVSFEKTYTELKRLYDLSGRRRKALRGFAKDKPLSYNLNTIKKRVMAFFKRRPEYYIDRITEICGSYSYGSTSYVAQLACPGIMARYDIKDVDSVHLTDFEDTQLYIADGFDQMMRNVYGDYMKLPPENERVPQQDYIHFYWKE